MNKEYTALLSQMQQIRDESVNKANTAVRVGTALIDLLDSLLSRGIDKQSDPTPPEYNTFLERNDFFSQVSSFFRQANEVSVKRLYVSGEENASLSENYQNNNSTLSYEDIRNRNSYCEVSNGVSIVSQVTKMLDILRTKQVRVEVNSTNFIPYISLYIQTTFNEDDGVPYLPQRQVELRITEFGVDFFVNNSSLLRINSNGIIDYHSFQDIEANTNSDVVMPYSVIKPYVINYTILLNLVKIEARYRPTLILVPSTLHSHTEIHFTFEKLILGASIKLFVRLASNGELWLDDMTNFFSLGLTKVSIGASKIQNTSTSSRTFCLEGTVVSFVSGTPMVYWQMSEFN